jgi:Cupin
MAATRADVLSQALTLVRLRGELVYSAQLRTPWSNSFPKGAAQFHFVEQGAIWIATLGVDPIHAKQGDMLLLPHGHG